jgi:nucleotide-binding universal stress UspA family protein
MRTILSPRILEVSEMPETLFQNVLVPIASSDDADATMRALRPYLRSVDGTVTVLHVIEKAGGAPDKASMEQREEHAEEIFDTARERVVDPEVDFATEIRYGTDVAETIIETAADIGATSIVFTPRGGSHWKRLLTGDVTHSLVTNSTLPVITLPDVDDT